MTTPHDDIPAEVDSSSKQDKKKRLSLRLALLTLLGLLLIGAFGFAGYVYASSPATIRTPQLEHYHFRMQIVINGKAENFSEDKYQQDYAKDQCNANLPEQPIHFHDKKDQFTHIHWEGMTGGMVMKYYGWNYIGGIDKALGYKLDNLGDIQKVNTHGNFLPTLNDDATISVYAGDENGYKERDFEDWKNQDLEEFFQTTSNFPAHDINKGAQTTMLDSFFTKVSAHGGADDGADGELGEETEEQKLTRINNMIGNVVLFAQKDKPTDQQIKERFNNLDPLTDSTCGG